MNLLSKLCFSVSYVFSYTVVFKIIKLVFTFKQSLSSLLKKQKKNYVYLLCRNKICKVNWSRTVIEIPTGEHQEEIQIKVSEKL